jgi:hypothetical protein
MFFVKLPDQFLVLIPLIIRVNTSFYVELRQFWDVVSKLLHGVANFLLTIDYGHTFMVKSHALAFLVQHFE